MQFHQPPTFAGDILATLQSLPLQYAPAIAFCIAVAAAIAVASATHRGGMR